MGRWECGVSFHQHRTNGGGSSALLWANKRHPSSRGTVRVRVCAPCWEMLMFVLGELSLRRFGGLFCL
jgi:hypothetical protein